MTHFSERHFRYYLSVVSRDPTDWRTIEAELSQIRVAWEWASTQPGHDVQVLELLWAMQPFIEHRTALDEQLRWYARALHSAEVVDLREDQARLQHHIGQVCRNAGDLGAALASYNAALATWSELGAQASVAVTLNNIGLVLQDRGEPDAAMTCYARAVSIYRAVGNRTEESTTLHNMGTLYLDMGEFDQAQQTYESALAIARAERDLPGEATTLYQLCVLNHDRGDFEAAVRGLNTVLTSVRESGDLRGEAMAESLLGDAYDGLEAWERAAASHARAVAIWRALGERAKEARALLDVCWSCYLQGDLVQAVQRIDEVAALKAALWRVHGRRSGALRRYSRQIARRDSSTQRTD